MEIYMALLLVLLQVKHWYVDFVNQTNEEVKYKGVYGNITGIKHSVKHGLGTLICLYPFLGLEYFGYALILSIFDSVTHYHIDWTKMNYGNRDIKNPKFWNHLGLDQMAHQITYLFIALMAI
jgi:hypothetical protein